MAGKGNSRPNSPEQLGSSTMEKETPTASPSLKQLQPLHEKRVSEHPLLSSNRNGCQATGVATFPDEAARLHKKLQDEYAERYEMYKKLAELYTAIGSARRDEPRLGRSGASPVSAAA